MLLCGNSRGEIFREQKIINVSVNAGSEGARRCSWLGHCTKSWKVAVSIPHDLNGIFERHNPSGLTMVAAGERRADALKDCLENWEPQPPGTFSLLFKCWL